MHTLVIDLESYYDKDFNLKKLPTLIYVRDPRFKLHGLAAKLDTAPAQWIAAGEVRDYLASIDWRLTKLITHNSLFDVLTLYERYGVTPAERIDTLALCRMLMPRDIDYDLDTVCPLLQIPGKVGGGAVLKKIKGLRDLSAELETELAEYALGDAESTYALYERLYPDLPEPVRQSLDQIVRISTEGVLELDPNMLTQAEAEIELDRHAKLKASGTTAEVLRSRDKFAELLKAHGVTPPTKVSKTTNKPTWAFAKQDPEFMALLAEPKVHHLVQARLAWASNNALSRIRHFRKIAALPPHTLPVQLNASGAHTHRLSGGGGINSQNLNRGSKLRLSIVAPKGHVIVVGDSSQAELRMNCWMSEQTNVLELLKAGGDPYIEEAARQYHVDPSQVTEIQRFFGKTIVLGCGYQLGAPTFRITCAAGPMGGEPILLTEEEAAQAIRTYREANPKIVANWKWLQNTGLPALLNREKSTTRKCLKFFNEEITLPSGLTLKYPELECTEEGWQWGINGRLHYIHGGILANNTTQALVGELIREQMLAIEHRLDGLGRVAHQVHDEILVVCPERDADDVSQAMREVMSTPPSWAPDLPLACKVAYDWRYSK